MTLLQNRKNESVNLSYLHEVKLQIEQIIELCKEGELSVFETSNIIDEEYCCIGDFQRDIIKMLEDLENGTFTLPIFYTNDKDSWIEIYKEDRRMMLEDINEYQTYIVDALNKIKKLFDGNDYQENRKLKIKQKIIQDGLSSLTENYQSEETLHSQEKNNIPEITTEEVSKIDEKILKSLLLTKKIKYKEAREIKKNSYESFTVPPEYWINTTVDDVEKFIIDYIKGYNIQEFPIRAFMKEHLKGKKGKDISASFRTAKSVNKHKRM